MTNDTRAAFEAAYQAACDKVYTLYPDFKAGWDAAYLASRRAALDEAAKVCEEMRDLNGALERAARGIRALGDEGVTP